MSDEQHEQIHDQGTGHMDGSEVANAAAESLHGTRAEEETNEQSDVTVLPSGTLIAEPTTEPTRGVATDDRAPRDDGSRKGMLSDKQ